jgi:hypothetical protein
MRGGGMTGEAEKVEYFSPEMEATASERAKIRARAARWDLDIAVFLFAILIIIIILLFQKIAIELVSLIAIFGLVVVWVAGWRRGKQLYQRFYVEELLKLEEARMQTSGEREKKMEETIEDIVKKALIERWH